MMKFQDYKNKVCSKKGCQSAVRNCWGVYDAYKHIRKNKWYDIGKPLTEHEFYSIIRSINKLLAKNLLLGETVVFPCRMGKLELRKSQRGITLNEGRLKVTYPVNWEDTLRLWYEDIEERKKKTLLRSENEFVYHVVYCRGTATYENKTFYGFSLNRFIKRGLKEYISQGKTDTLW